MKHFTLGRLIVVGIAIQLVASSVASAQTSAGGLFAPWPKAQNYDIRANALFQNEGKTSVGNNDFTLNAYESYGRFRFSEEHKLNPSIGYSVEYLDLDSNSPILPGQLTDESIGFGTPFYQWQSGWFVAGNVAVGYAGERPFATGDAWYGKATAIVGKELSDGPTPDTLVFGLDYNGNRSFMPDVPLPGFAYSHRIDKTLLMAVGFPYESIEWAPIDGLKVDVYVELPDVFRGRVSYNFIEKLGVYVSYEDRTEPFHVDGLHELDRFFYISHRVEGGVRFDPVDQVSIFASVGYAFGQEFDTGFDSRNLDNVTDVSDEMFWRIGVEARF